MAKLVRVQLSAMVRKDCLHMKLYWVKNLATFLFSTAMGIVIGQLHRRVYKNDNPDAHLFAYLLISLSAPLMSMNSVHYVACEMVKEKQIKMNQALHSIGLDTWVYAFSFLLHRSIWLAFPCLSFTLCIFAFNEATLNLNDFVALFFCFWLYCVGSVSFSMALSNFFSNPHFASMVLQLLLFMNIGIASVSITGRVDEIQE